MNRLTHLSLAALALTLLVNPAAADNDKELRKQRQAAQKERQTAKNERSRQINEAIKSFREFSRQLKKDYQARLRDLDTDFQLRRVEIDAERNAAVATAEAEYQQKLMNLLTTGGEGQETETLEKLQADMKAHADSVFELRRRFAQKSHEARIVNEKRKHAELDERDSAILEEAAALGLTKDYTPILASAIGGELTKQEESWNSRQKKEVDRIKQRNQRTLVEFTNGPKSRALELDNLQQDFELEWQEKAELQAVSTQTGFYNALLVKAMQGGEIDQQEVTARMTELNKQNQLIRIEYNKKRQQNQIKRREQQRKLQGR